MPMTAIAISASEYASRWFLLSFFEQHPERAVELVDEGRVQLVDEVVAEHRIVLIGAGLSFQLLHQIQVAMQSRFRCLRYSLSKANADTLLPALVVDIEPLQAELTNELQWLATEFRLDVGWLNQPPTLTKPGLLVMDMDSTMIDCECIDEIAYLGDVGEQVSAVTELAMQGKLDFAASLTQRVSCLAGIEEDTLQRILRQLPIMPGLPQLVGRLQQAGWKVAIASGGFTYFAHYLRDMFELDEAVSNHLEVVDGKLTGRVAGNIVDARIKADTVTRLAQQWLIEQPQTVVVGDGANDLLMMEVAALGIAFHAKPVVEEQADQAIRYSGLDSILHLLAN